MIEGLECESCQFYEPIGDARNEFDVLKAWGICHRDPKAMSVWTDYWCGEYVYLEDIPSEEKEAKK